MSRCGEVIMMNTIILNVWIPTR